MILLKNATLFSSYCNTSVLPEKCHCTIHTDAAGIINVMFVPNIELGKEIELKEALN